MGIDNRRYTDATIAEMHRIAFIVALRKFIAVTSSQWRYAQDDGSYGAGLIDGLALVNQWIEEHEPCDNPPAEGETC